MKERGRRIRSAREALRLSQEELAARLGISQSYLSQWESGKKRRIDSDQLRKLAENLGVSVTILLYGGELTEQHWNSSLPEGGRAVPMHVIEDAVARRAPSTVGPKLSANFPCSSESYWLILPNDANGPQYPKGAKVIFDPSETPEPGAIVLATHGEDTTPIIGQLSHETTPVGRVVLVTPLNKRWSAARSDIETVEIIAVMTEVSQIVPR